MNVVKYQLRVKGLDTPDGTNSVRALVDLLDAVSEMPVQTEADFLSSVFQAAEGKDWLKEVWGKLPGDEPIEALLEDLKR